MTKAKGRTVSRRADGTWANKRDGAKRAASLHRTQGAAAKEATRMLKKSGGGELKVKNEKGKIRSKDTITPGRESRVKDKEH
jgi:hypothetical protein